jgi:hypothetical protein
MANECALPASNWRMQILREGCDVSNLSLAGYAT